MALNLWKYSSPQTFYPVAGRLVPWFFALAAVLAVIGLYIGFFVAPTDFQQGESYRIIFIHVPAAWMSMFIYVVMAFWCAVGMILNTRLSFMMALALAPTGAMFTFVALWTGSLWGKPTWGTWWAWDARMTSELILLFLYIGFISLHAAIDDVRRADRAAAPAGIGGRDQCAHHLLLGEVVEHAAPGCFRELEPRAVDGGDDAYRDAADVARGVDVRHCREPAALARHHSGARERGRLGA